MKHYIIRLLPLTAVVGITSFAMKNWVLADQMTSFWWILLIFFFGLSLISHNLLVKATTGKSDQFSVFFLLASTVKLLLYLAFLLIFHFAAGGLEIPFLLVFAAYYLIFTSLDVAVLLRQIKDQDNPQKTEESQEKL